MTNGCAHDFQPVRDERFDADWPRPPVFVPGKFACSKCGLEVELGGALSNPRDAHDASYRPDLPLKSTQQNVAAWADGVRSAEDAKR